MTVWNDNLSCINIIIEVYSNIILYRVRGTLTCKLSRNILTRCIMCVIILMGICIHVKLHDMASGSLIIPCNWYRVPLCYKHSYST